MKIAGDTVEIHEKAYAKINLTLDVLGKLESGMHEVVTVMQSVSLCDEVELNVTSGTGRISVFTDRDDIPNDMHNIAYKAAAVFFDETGISDADVSVRIVKHNPVGAGMGGGSTDGAAVLRGLNKALGTELSDERLRQMAKKVGSDVPFCVSGGTALATGTGTEIEPLPALNDCTIVICKPGFSVSTPVLFSRIDSVSIKRRPDAKAVVSAVKCGDIKKVAENLCNVFEEALDSGYAETVSRIKSIMCAHGALGAAMTGTGSAVFGIFDDPCSARRAYEALRRDYAENYICTPVYGEK